MPQQNKVASLTVDCPICLQQWERGHREDTEILDLRVYVDPGERRTWHHPGSPASVDYVEVRGPEPACGHHREASFEQRLLELGRDALDQGDLESAYEPPY